jgi:hypothetical protein
LLAEIPKLAVIDFRHVRFRLCSFQRGTLSAHFEVRRVI